MCKKNVKWYLKDTDKTVSIGDEVTFNQSISFTKYPNMEFETSVTHPIDAEDLKILEDSDIVEKKEIEERNWEFYLKYWANVKNLDLAETIHSFNFTCKVNPNAALSILLKAISFYINKRNGNLKYLPSKIWIFDIATYKPVLIDVTNDTQLSNIAWFVTKDDLDYALKACKPILK